jgi:hypothetical protein
MVKPKREATLYVPNITWRERRVNMRKSLTQRREVNEKV